MANAASRTAAATNHPGPRCAGARAGGRVPKWPHATSTSSAMCGQRPPSKDVASAWELQSHINQSSNVTLETAGRPPLQHGTCACKLKSLVGQRCATDRWTTADALQSAWTCTSQLEYQISPDRSLDGRHGTSWRLKPRACYPASLKRPRSSSEDNLHL